MKFTNPNQFEKIRRLEGMHTPEDIWDLVTLEDIKTEIEKRQPNILEELSAGDLSPELKRCFSKTKTFCSELTEEFRQKFLTLLYQYKQEGRHISPKIIDYLLEKKFDLPNFTITYGGYAQELLEEYGLEGQISDQNLLLVFQLPKPLSQYWWKGGGES